MTGATAHPWFYVREALPGVWMINEPQHVCSWLVAGSERAVLLDTGLGVMPIRPVAQAAVGPGRPVSVVNTHYHFDHVGGNAEFAEIAIHRIGAPLLTAEAPQDVLRAYAGFAQRMVGSLDAYRRLDDEFYWQLTAESTPRPFPPSFDAQRWRIPASHATRTLDEGDRVDLGGRELTVLHTPGHSPDSISLLDEHDGTLFAADVFNIGPVYCHFPDSDLDDLARSARRLADLGDAVARIVVHHYGRVIAEPSLLADYARDIERVRAGDVATEPGTDILDDRLLSVRFDQWSITLPDPDVAPRSLTG
jgi:glyoxylase-like metal-dependent hydrolase (beta-lactamase superfamily II)